jgi:class 3 adenylate cyclase
MPKIRCLPDELAVERDGEQTILSALIEAEVPIAHACDGKARCSTCRVRIVDGHDAVTERTRGERSIADRLGLPDEIRLACQTSTVADVTIERLVLDEIDGILADQTDSARVSAPVGTELDITVLFADVVGYTALADGLPAYDILHILNRFFRGAGRVVEINNGRVDNYMGDAILALFGVDGEEIDPCGAVKAGLEMLAVANSVSEYVSRLYGRAFSIRVGVHHGRVVVGSIGGEGSARTTAIGEAVNLASRLEAANKDLGTDMLASEQVIRRCRESVVCGRTFELDLRGIAEDTKAFEVLGVASETT